MAGESPSDAVQFANELPATPSRLAQSTFKLLIVDDDRDVHLITKQVLAMFYPPDEQPNYFHAYNSLDAYTILAWERDIAVVLLDVVMESTDAGLRLIRDIRNDLNLSRTQIILRTGQPGMASEDDVIANYEINGYLAKSDLTPSKLFSAITTARRAYRQLCKEAHGTTAANAPIETASPSANELEIEAFTLKAMMQFAALFKTPCMGFVLRRLLPGQPLTVTATTPEFSNLSGLTLQAIQDRQFSDRVEFCLATRESVIDQEAATLFVPGSQLPPTVIHLIRETDSVSVEKRALDILIANFVTGMEKLVQGPQRR